MMRLIAIACLLIWPMSIIAAELEPLPDVETMELATYTSNSKEMSQIFIEDDGLDFTVTLPADFLQKPDEQLRYIENGNILEGEVFHAYGTAFQGKRPFFTVESFRMNREISAKSWFINRVLENGYTLRGLEIDADKQQHFEAFYVRLNSIGDTEIVRARGFRNLNRMVLAEFVVPQILWMRDKDKQIYAIKSFEFMNDFAVLPIEPVFEYEYLDSFAMNHLKSLRLVDRKTPSSNIHRLVFSSADEDGYELSKVKVELIGRYALNEINRKREYRVNLPEAIKNHKAEIAETGFEHDDLLENRQYDLLTEAQLQVTEVYPLRKKQREIFMQQGEKPITHEFWMTVIKGAGNGDKNYVISMFAPSRDDNFYNWSLAERAYQIVIESLR